MQRLKVCNLQRTSLFSRQWVLWNLVTMNGVQNSAGVFSANHMADVTKCEHLFVQHVCAFSKIFVYLEIMASNGSVRMHKAAYNSNPTFILESFGPIIWERDRANTNDLMKFSSEEDIICVWYVIMTNYEWILTHTLLHISTIHTPALYRALSLSLLSHAQTLSLYVSIYNIYW